MVGEPNCCELWVLAQGYSSWLGWGLGGLGAGEAVVALMLHPWGKIIRQYFFVLLKASNGKRKTRENSLASIIYPANEG